MYFKEKTMKKKLSKWEMITATVLSMGMLVNTCPVYAISATSVIQQEAEHLTTVLEKSEDTAVLKANEFPDVCIQDGIARITYNGNVLPIHDYTMGNAWDAKSFAIIKFSQNTMVSVKALAEEPTEVSLTESGVYTFYVTDTKSRDHYISKYYNADANILGEVIDFSDLNYEITLAQSLYEATPDSSIGLAMDASYSDAKAKECFLEAIKSAKFVAFNAEKQEDVTTALEVLKSAESTFRETIKTVSGNLVEVNGSSIIVKAHKGCTISRVRYNADENGKLVNGIWKSYAGANYEGNRVAKFSDFTWNHVEDGIYTFEIRETDANGNPSTTFELAVVDTKETSVALAQDFLSRLIQMVSTYLDGVKPKSVAHVGDTYAPDPRYYRMFEVINESYRVAADGAASFSEVVEASYTLFDTMRSFTKFTYIMEEKDLIATADITEEQGTIHVAKKELRQIYYARGIYQTLDEIKNADGQICWPNDSVGSFKVDYNDYYTLFITYADNSTELRIVEVTDIPSPFTITEENGLIHIENTGYDVKQLGYCYGDSRDITSEQYTLFHEFRSDFELEANGLITFYLKDCNDEEYFETIQVQNHEKPWVVVKKDSITPYTYGFDITRSTIAKGHFTSWDAMNPAFVLITPNQPIYTKHMQESEYTFYFVDTDGNEYFEYVTVE